MSLASRPLLATLLLLGCRAALPAAPDAPAAAASTLSVERSALDVHAAPGNAVDRVSSYTLQLGPDGRPRDGYFYLGFVHGQPHQAVELGFNARQSTAPGSAPFYGKPLSAPADYPDPFGLRYYSLAWGAESLQSAIGWAKKAGARATPAQARLAALPPALSADGAPRRRRASLNLFDPATVDLLRAYVRAHVEAWSGGGTGARIDRWGLDNEWEGEGGPDYSPEARAAFAAWLDRAYAGRIASLNAAWHKDWPDFKAAASGPLPAPADYAARPAAFLDWWTFQTEHFTTVLAGLARVMHDTDPLHRGVVHKSTQQTIEMPGVNRVHLFDHDRFASLMRPLSGGLYGIDMYGSGDRQAYELDYIYNCIRPLDGSPGYGVFLPETNNHGGPGNAFAATAWRMLANGLKAADLFTLGFAGATDDWDKFGFLDPATGAPKDKLFYAARWAHAIHRTEAFWEKSTPAPGLPRVALLMPRRDVLLSPLSPRTTSRWSFPRDHRWMLYRWLREQGYWVDVIPYSKLVPANLASYQGLFLIGANHLTDAELKAVSGFAAAGGIVVADTEAASRDEHHRPRASGLLPFIPADAGNGELALDLEGHTVTASGAVSLGNTGAAQVLSLSTDKRPAALLAPSGRGRVLYFPFELGSLILRQPGQAMPAFLAEGPTADSEEYIIPSGELSIGRWLAGLLRSAGLAPATTASKTIAATGNLRVEQPFVDAAGNVAVVITTRADSAKRALPAGTVTLPLPGGPWTRALLAPAEDDGLVEVPVRPIVNRNSKIVNLHELTLPSLPTAGIVYLFKQHEPLLGIPAIAAPARCIDGYTAKVAPGYPFTVTVQLANTTGAALPAGSLRVILPAGWHVDHADLPTPALDAGALHTATLAVTPEADDALIKPDWLYPLVVRWSDGTRDRAVITANVEVAIPPGDVTCLLSGNASYPPTYPWRIQTGATYSYDAPSDARAIADPAKKGKTASPALTNGFNVKTGLRTTSAHATAQYALYHTPEVGVVFDLKAVHELRRVVVNRGPDDLPPPQLQLLTSADGKTFVSQPASAEPTVTEREYAFTLPRVPARYVKLTARWSAPGGTLNEVEIWGR